MALGLQNSGYLADIDFSKGRRNRSPRPTNNKTDPAGGSVLLDIECALRRGGKASGILEDFFYRLFEVIGLRGRGFFASGEAAARATVIAAVAAALAITVVAAVTITV